MKPRLFEKYENEVKPALKEKRGYKNVHQIPIAGRDRRQRAAGPGRAAVLLDEEVLQP